MKLPQTAWTGLSISYLSRHKPWDTSPAQVEYIGRIPPGKGAGRPVRKNLISIEGGFQSPWVLGYDRWENRKGKHHMQVSSCAKVASEKQEALR